MAVYQHDVLVVGAGLAGMRATLAAQEAGADYVGNKDYLSKY